MGQGVGALKGGVEPPHELWLRTDVATLNQSFDFPDGKYWL